MKDSTKVYLNEDLENLEKKVGLIGFSDPEKYKEFFKRIKDLQRKLIGISEQELERTKVDIIFQISKLQSDFDSYMDGSSYPIEDGFDPNKKIETGKSKLKGYKISLYKRIIEDLKKIDFIEITDIGKLKEKWKEDSADEYLSFSAFEKSEMEEAISDGFLEYQIKFINKNGIIPSDRITDYTSKEEYKNRIKQKLIDITQQSRVSAKKRLEIEELYKIDDLEQLLKNKLLWEVLATKTVLFSEKQINKMLDKKEEQVKEETLEEPKKEESTLPMVIPKKKISNKYMICTIKKTNKFFNKDKVSYKQIKVKVKDGVAILPHKYKHSIVEVYIPEGVTTIGNNGFSYCKELKTVHLPSTLKTIEKEAFLNCYQMENINLPEGLTTLGDKALYYCVAANNIAIPQNITSIGDYACYGVPIKELILSEKLEKLGMAAFESCRDLEKLVLPPNLKAIPYQCFSNCSNLRDITFPSKLEHIASLAFGHCDSITDLSNLPDSIKTLAEYAFFASKNIQKIRIPSSLIKVGRYAFDERLKLDEILLPTICSNINVISDLSFDPETKIKMPNEMLEDTYLEMGIKEGQTLRLKDLRVKVAIENERKRSDLWKETQKKKEDASVNNKKITLDDEQFGIE